MLGVFPEAFFKLVVTVTLTSPHGWAGFILIKWPTHLVSTSVKVSLKNETGKLMLVVSLPWNDMHTESFCFNLLVTQTFNRTEPLFEFSNQFLVGYTGSATATRAGTLS